MRKPAQDDQPVTPEMRLRSAWANVMSTEAGRIVLEDIRALASADGESLPFEGAAAANAIGRLDIARFIEARVCKINPQWLGQMRSDLALAMTVVPDSVPIDEDAIE